MALKTLYLIRFGLIIDLSDGLQVLHVLTKDKREHYQKDFDNAFYVGYI